MHCYVHYIDNNLLTPIFAAVLSQVCCAGDGTAIMTGSYNNSFKIYDVAKQSETTIELSKSKPKPGTTRPIHGTGMGGEGGSYFGLNGDVTMSGTSHDPSIHQQPPVDVDDIDFSKKVLHYSWHPTEDIVAVCGCNNLFLFQLPPAAQLAI